MTQEDLAPAGLNSFELLALLRSLDIRLRAEEGQLRFSAPKGALNAELRAELARRKGEILELLRAAGDGGGEPIPRAARDGDLALSFSQLRIWFMEQFEPGTTAWHLPEAVRLRGRLSVAALRRSLTEMVRRHESLRTTFDARAGQPVQVIGREARLDTPVVDLGRLEPEVRERASRRLARRMARRTFDLERGPLLRTLLLRLDGAEHVFLINLHHLVFDRWSMGVFLGEMAALYAAFAAGRPSPLPELTVQYADFAHWQRQRLQGETLETLLGYWRRQLAGAPGVLPLPTDRPRPPIRTETGARRGIALSPALTADLKRLCGEHDVTLFMALLAACDVLLWRSTGRRDLCVGTVIANRVRPELEGLIGFLLNTLVLRTDLGGRPSFASLLERVRQAALGAYAHQELPFERLIEDLRPERELSYTPFFQVMVVFQNTPAPGIDLAGLEAAVLEYEGVAAANSDVGFWMWEDGERIAGYLEYNTILFDAVSALRMFAELRTLLEAAVRRPALPISGLPVLPAAARHQLFVEWNDVPAPPADRGGCFHELFERRAERVPEATAVVLEDAALTYGELNARANRLGRRLRRLGVGPEIRVAVFLEYSLEMVVAVLGVMKSGGAFVPLDADHARQRVGELARGAAVVLTQARLAGDLPGDLAAAVVLLDAREEIASLDGENLAPLAGPSNLVYMVYTSGTTGRPKGVMIRHAALMNIFHGHRLGYGLDDGMAHLQMASFSFDVFTGDLVRALGTGGKLVMCPRDVVLLPGELDALMRRHRVSAAEFVPAVLRGLMRQAEDTGENLDFMRLFAVASDVWYVREYEKLRRELAPRARVSGTYGVTEVNIDSTTFQSAFPGAATSLPLDAYVPVGRPFAGNPLYVLDRHGLAVPPGAVGEMCIGGPGVARGYSGQPAATAQKFVPDPRSGVPGARLYRTGDRVRSLHDGNVDFLGRVDFQVKIRGFRIEPGEIEAILDEHPEVAQAVVIAREDVPGNRFLAAYFVSRAASRPPAAGELRQFLKERLPDYMVPAVFVHLDALPLNPNNKVDRRALPAPAGADLADREHTAPRTGIEEALAEIFQQVTGAARVGVHDDFFTLGGHSLLATQVISRVRESFEVELPLRTFFELPTVAELGLWIEEALIARVEELSEQEIEALL